MVSAGVRISHIRGLRLHVLGSTLLDEDQDMLFPDWRGRSATEWIVFHGRWTCVVAIAGLWWW